MAQAQASPRQQTDQGDLRFVGRQAILDRKGQVAGYELLDRHVAGPGESRTPGTDGDSATARVLHHAMHVLHPQKLLDNRQAFVNFTRNGLVEETYAVAPPRMLVVELLEDIVPDPEVFKAARHVRKQGYTLALDDFADAPGYEQLCGIADVIKIDWMLTTPPQRAAMVQRLQRPGLRFLAEKVETQADHHEAQRLHCSLFQGFFYQKPELISGRELPSATRTWLRFLELVNHPVVDFDKLEQVVKQDATIATQLLRRLNSVSSGCSQRITSIKQALVMMGERPLQRWAAVVALACIAENKPHALMHNALVRAHFCEKFGEQIGIKGRPFDLFMLGLLSLLDAATDQQLPDLLSTIDLPDDMVAALLSGEGMLGRVLAVAKACERCEIDRVNHLLTAPVATVLPPSISLSDATSAFADAEHWADRTAL